MLAAASHWFLHGILDGSLPQGGRPGLSWRCWLTGSSPVSPNPRGDVTLSRRPDRSCSTLLWYLSFAHRVRRGDGGGGVSRHAGWLARASLGGRAVLSVLCLTGSSWTCIIYTYPRTPNASQVHENPPHPLPRPSSSSSSPDSGVSPGANPGNLPRLTQQEAARGGNALAGLLLLHGSTRMLPLDHLPPSTSRAFPVWATT